MSTKCHGRTENGTVKIMEYDVENFLRPCVDRYVELSNSVNAVTTPWLRRLDTVATQFGDEKMWL